MSNTTFTVKLDNGSRWSVKLNGSILDGLSESIIRGYAEAHAIVLQQAKLRTASDEATLIAKLPPMATVEPYSAPEPTAAIDKLVAKMTPEQKAALAVKLGLAG